MRSLLSSLIDYWPLHEASGNRESALAQHALTDTNTVTQAQGRAVYAGQFTATSSERLVATSDSALQTGDIEWTLACWVYHDTLPGTAMYLVGKDNGSTQREYALRWGGTRFQAIGFRSGPTIVTVSADTLGAPATATWYFVTGWHDSVADTINIEVNMTGVDSAATAGAFITSTADLNLGASANGASFLDGRLCEVAFWKRILTTQERAWLYNSGMGRTYPFDGRPSPVALGRGHGRVGKRRSRVPGMVA